MNLRRRHIAAGLAITLSTGVLALASAALADGNSSTQAVKFGAETWYQPDPTCQLPTGCLSTGVTPPATNPYGAGTLHVSVAAGTTSATETSRTYLSLPAIVIPAGQTLTGAAFTAPLDTSPTSGSTAPETSTTHVCTTNGTITATEGEFDDPPETLCGTDAPLTYVAASSELTGDLTAVLNAHLADLSAGKLSLAIIPLDAPMTAAWNDVFSSNDRTSAGPAAPSLTLTFAAGGSTSPIADTSSATPTASSAPSIASSVTPKASSVAAPVTTAAAPIANGPAPVTAVVPQPGAVTAEVPAPTVGEASAVPAPVVASSSAPAADQTAVGNDTQVAQNVASTRTVGFAYPAVLLLPLVLVAGGAGLARVMTRDLTPRQTRGT